MRDADAAVTRRMQARVPSPHDPLQGSPVQRRAPGPPLTLPHASNPNPTTRLRFHLPFRSHHTPPRHRRPHASKHVPTDRLHKRYTWLSRRSACGARSARVGPTATQPLNQTITRFVSREALLASMRAAATTRECDRAGCECRCYLSRETRSPTRMPKTLPQVLFSPLSFPACGCNLAPL